MFVEDRLPQGNLSVGIFLEDVVGNTAGAVAITSNIVLGSVFL